MDKKLISEIEGNKETVSFIELELSDLNLEINLKKDLFCVKYGNILNRFFNLLDKKRKIKVIK